MNNLITALHNLVQQCDNQEVDKELIRDRLCRSERQPAIMKWILISH